MEAFQYIQDIAAHFNATSKRLEHYGVTDFILQGTPRESFAVLLVGASTWREIMRTPQRFTYPQTVIGAYTHAALPLSANTQFAWMPNEALAIAANRYAYPPNHMPNRQGLNPQHNPQRIPRNFKRFFDANDFDKVMDKKREETPYVHVDSVTYRTQSLPSQRWPRWHHELPGLITHYFWQPFMREPRVRLLILPEAEYVHNLLRPRDIIHALRVTGPGWTLLPQSQVLAEYTRVRDVLSTQ